jgi:hypothetical protein
MELELEVALVWAFHSMDLGLINLLLLINLSPGTACKEEHGPSPQWDTVNLHTDNLQAGTIHSLQIMAGQLCNLHHGQDKLTYSLSKLIIHHLNSTVFIQLPSHQAAEIVAIPNLLSEEIGDSLLLFYLKRSNILFAWVIWKNLTINLANPL